VTSNDEAGTMPASEQAENAEWMLDRDLDAAEPEQDAAEHVERLERHSEPTDTPAHPESRGRPEAPRRS
jgi:hypothetical protein